MTGGVEGLSKWTQWCSRQGRCTAYAATRGEWDWEVKWLMQLLDSCLKLVLSQELRPKVQVFYKYSLNMLTVVTRMVSRLSKGWWTSTKDSCTCSRLYCTEESETEGSYKMQRRSWYDSTFVADDFSYDMPGQRQKNVSWTSLIVSKHNAETSHVQHFKQWWRWRTHYCSLVQGTERH